MVSPTKNVEPSLRRTNLKAAEMSVKLNELVEELCPPDIAWYWRNCRPESIENFDSLNYGNRPRKGTGLFYPKSEVRNFFLPAESWELLSEMLLANFCQQAGWRCTDADGRETYIKVQCKNKVDGLNEIGWALELLEHREPELTHGGEALRMNWGNWFEVLNLELRVAAYLCPEPSLRHYVSCLITLRSQCDPENSCFLTQSYAIEEADSMIEEIREQQRDLRRWRLSS
ncbi:hypothetical protein OAE87_01105 [bacterium]|nr:hypothetical protein [bacterium]